MDTSRVYFRRARPSQRCQPLRIVLAHATLCLRLRSSSCRSPREARRRSTAFRGAAGWHLVPRPAWKAAPPAPRGLIGSAALQRWATYGRSTRPLTPSSTKRIYRPASTRLLSIGSLWVVTESEAELLRLTPSRSTCSNGSRLVTTLRRPRWRSVLVRSGSASRRQPRADWRWRTDSSLTDPRAVKRSTCSLAPCSHRGAAPCLVRGRATRPSWSRRRSRGRPSSGRGVGDDRGRRVSIGSAPGASRHRGVQIP